MRAARAFRGLLVAALAAGPLAVLPVPRLGPLPGLPARSAEAAEEIYTRPADGVFKVEGHGWGHGHGMNQWGAEGAARQGKTATQILDAYYPGTAQQVLPARTIRVLINEDDHADLVVDAASGLALYDVTSKQTYALVTTPTRWRIYTDATGEHVQYYTSGWTTWKSPSGQSAFGGPLQFQGPATLRLRFADGGARDYRGGLRAVRTGSTTINVVNALDLEQYLYGVVPRESPASWHAAALQAQAVAARSYSTYKLDHAPAGSTYDICSTTQCQVYGGVRIISPSGTVTNLESASTNAAVDATKGVCRTYGGAAIFAEFSSSNGGWSTQGSMPYLAPNADPWDAIASPHHYWTASLTAGQLEARYPAVGRLLRIRVTQRDGNGDWGGRVKNVILEGVDSAGNGTSVSATGGGVYLAHTWPTYADGLRGSWWHITQGYAAEVVATNYAPKLVQKPGNPKGDLVVRYQNTGTQSWPVSGLHLALAGPMGGQDPMVGNSTTPGTYLSNISRPGATSVAPGDVARFAVHLDASNVAPGSYAKSYAVQVGSGAIFGEVAQWIVAVQAPVFSAALVSFAGTAPPPTDGSPPTVWPDGTVVMPRTGSVALNVKVKNTSNFDWPLNGAVRLGASGPRYRDSASYGAEWTNKQQVGPPTSVDGVAGATVAHPGDVAVFPVTLHGNNVAAGVTNESFEPAYYGYAWLGGAKLTLHVVRTDPAVKRAATMSRQPVAMKLLAYPGDKKTLVFWVRNLGGEKWVVGGDDVLGTASPADRTDVLRTSAWLSATRSTRLAGNVARTAATAVWPGEVGVFNVPIDPTNKAAATYGEYFRAIYGTTWYGPTMGSTVTVSAATLSASLVRNTTGLKVPRTGAATYTIELENTGNTTWKVQSNLRLSTKTASPSATSSWISATRPAAITLNVTNPGAAYVKPGEVARFTFQVGGNGRAPGTYTESFGAGWEAWRSTGLRIAVTYVLT